MSQWKIGRLGEEDRMWLPEFFAEHWGGQVMVYGARNQQFNCGELPGFAAWEDGRVVGLLTYCDAAGERQIVSLDSLREGLGIGTALMKAAEEEARQNQVTRIWLLTTNDNLNALRFYQKRGYELACVHRRAVDMARKAKPSIPLVGEDGIPLRDELELEKRLEE
ncbi:GNAT family N-acetyltransferase [Brevibacillus brevis]|uniref:GNAT family N-acetyltransferase n=1 Tax=Brevibacillus brevis TaxID=1393 RepID=A0ABY9T0G3_BREBE|nr:GNAT family N-acetyltransferase [Brevibacillus brevis]WNC13546.1 GNAT family N-acetyltransferase [Brevibacillus brevis]